MTTTTYAVTGMTCDHCVRSVKGEIEQLSGVSAVDIELATGDVTVTSEGDLDEAQVRAAVEEAGYELAS